MTTAKHSHKGFTSHLGMSQWIPGPWPYPPPFYTSPTPPHHAMQFQAPPQHAMQAHPGVPAQMTPKREKPACLFFGSQPGCRNGTRCAFRHDVAIPADRTPTWPDTTEKREDYIPLTPRTRKSEPETGQRVHKDAGVCMSFIIEGKFCERGDRCPFKHADTPKWPSDTCMFHVATGKCKYGDNCSYQHPAKTTRPSNGREIYRDADAQQPAIRGSEPASNTASRVENPQTQTPLNTPSAADQPANNRREDAAAPAQEDQPAADDASPTYSPQDPHLLLPVPSSDEELSEPPDDTRGGPPDDLPLEYLQQRPRWTRDDMHGGGMRTHCYSPCNAPFPNEHVPSGIKCVYRHCKATFWNAPAPDQSLSCCWYCPTGREHFIHNECFDKLKAIGREWYCPKCEPDNNGRRAFYCPYYDRLRRVHTPCMYRQRLDQARYNDAPVRNRHPKAPVQYRREDRNRQNERSRRNGRQDRNRRPRSQQHRKVTVRRRTD